MQAADPDPPGPTSDPPPKSGIDALTFRSIPRDGGTLLAAAAVLGALSFVSHLERIRIGAGPIPAWVPLAVDTAIAGACGLTLTLGAGLFAEREETAPAGSVIVAKPVWESIQREIVAARTGHAPPRPAVPAPVPASAQPAAPPNPDGLNPWDEGPPTRPAEPAAPLPGPSVNLPPVPSPPPSNPLPSKALAGAVPLRATPSAPSAPRPAVATAGTPLAPPPVPAPSAPVELSAAELEEISRMGGILGVVPLKGETGQSYSRRLARAREALAGPTSVTPAPEPWIESPTPEPKTEPGSSPDIDELMSWLEKIAADGTAAGERKPRKKEPSTGESDSERS